jgi:exodeoxyribonuclease VII small subunit
MGDKAFKIGAFGPCGHAQLNQKAASMTKKTAAASPEVSQLTYEEAVTELDSLISRLDAGQLPLEALLSQYQRGAELLQHCRTQLEAVEAQIKVVEGQQLRNWTDKA